MATNDAGFSSLSDDWSVILSSCNSKLKKELVKRISEIFELDKKDAEQALSNMPLILLDNLSFGMATRIKNYFVKLGAVVETTNMDMIKKNYSQVLWPEVPDLSFFLNEETKPPFREAKPEPMVPAPAEPSRPVSHLPPVPEKEPPVAPAPQKDADGWEKIVKDSMISQYSRPDDGGAGIPKEAATPEASKSNDGWEKRAQELSKKLASFQEEKKKVDEDIVLRAVEKDQSDFGSRPEAEKPRSEEEIPSYFNGMPKPVPESPAAGPVTTDWRAKAMLLNDRVRDLEKDLIDSKEELVKEVEKLRSKAASAEGRAHELEAALSQKSQDMDRMARDKEELTHHGFKVRDLEAQIEGLNSDLAEKNRLAADRDSALGKAQQELEAIRERERELTRKAESLQASVNAMEESLRDRDEQLRVRDESLAAFEKQLGEFAAAVRELEPVRQEHAQFLQERGTIRKEYETKLAEVEVRAAKTDDDHRRYRSRTDRKLAAATRELGEWVRGVEALRQGLQKLVVFLSSESAVPDPEKKSPFRTTLNRASNSNGSDQA